MKKESLLPDLDLTVGGESLFFQFLMTIREFDEPYACICHGVGCCRSFFTKGLASEPVRAIPPRCRGSCLQIAAEV